MATQQVVIPDLGGADNVVVIEVLVKPGEDVVVDQPLLTLESEKATMEVPAPFAGRVTSLQLAVGDTVTQGMVIGEVSVLAKEEAVSPRSPSAPDKAEPVSRIVDLLIPDLGGAGDVKVIEILVDVGDNLAVDAPLITLESEKATMEVPTQYAGVVESIDLTVGQTVVQGDVLGRMTTSDATEDVKPDHLPSQSVSIADSVQSNPVHLDQEDIPGSSTDKVYAGPAVRRLAYELNIDLTLIKGQGKKGRIRREDLYQYVKQRLQQSAGTGLPTLPQVDFTRFGEVITEPLSKIKRATAKHMIRTWLNVPQVTQFDEVDITELEAMRQQVKASLAKQNIRLTPLVFVLKAVANTLQAFPHFCASLSSEGGDLIVKKYCHVGIAVDTSEGLVVPVVRDVDQKDVLTLAQELMTVSEAARAGTLTPQSMQGGCFTLSSLGGIGGTQFTPIVNAPEVAILGVSKSQYRPIYDTKKAEFVPRLMMPLALSYDHRAIDGVQGAKFMMHLSAQLVGMHKVVDVQSEK